MKTDDYYEGLRDALTEVRSIIKWARSSHAGTADDVVFRIISQLNVYEFANGAEPQSPYAGPR